MGRGPEMALSVGHTIHRNGIEVVAVIQQPEPDPYSHITPGKTAIYEARHALVARKRGVGVRGVTARPGPGFLGATYLDSFDGPTAMVHAGDGDGHDRRITIARGINPDSAAATANSILNQHGKALNRLARALESNGSLGRHDVDHEIAEAEKKPEIKADLFVKTKNGGSEKVKDVPVKNGIVIYEILTLKKKEQSHENDHIHDVFFGKQDEFELAG